MSYKFRKQKILAEYKESGYSLIHKKSRFYDKNICNLCKSYSRKIANLCLTDSRFFVSVKSRYSLLAKSSVLIFKYHTEHIPCKTKLEHELVNLYEKLQAGVMYVNSYSAMSIPSHFHAVAVTTSMDNLKINERVGNKKVININPVYFIEIPFQSISSLRGQISKMSPFDANIIFSEGRWFAHLYDKSKVLFDYGTQESFGIFGTSSIEKFNKIKNMGLGEYQKMVSVPLDKSVKFLQEFS